MDYIKNKYYGSLIIGSLLMGITYSIAYIFGWVDVSKINYLEIFAVWTSYICTLMFAFQTRMAYPIGVVTTAAYSYLFFQWNLPAVAIFNLYLVFSLAYGYWFWRSDANPTPVSHYLTTKDYFIYPGVALVVYVVLYFINYFMGYDMGTVDIIVAVLSGVAQFGLDRKQKYNFIIWSCVNLFSIYLYYNQGLYLVTLQYVAFLGTSVYSLWLWNKA